MYLLGNKLSAILKERDQGATITVPGRPRVFSFNTCLFTGVCGGRGRGREVARGTFCAPEVSH